MTITQAVAFLRNCARNGQDSSMYTAAMCEQAIQSACNDFLLAQNVKATRTLTDLALTQGVADLPALPATFRPDYLQRAYLTSLTNPTGQNPRVDVIDFGQVLNILVNNSTTQAQPCMVGFDAATTGKVAPLPNAAYTLRFAWDPPFTTWTAGNPILSVTIAGTDNHVSAVNILSGGSGLTAAPALTFANAGSGSAATATATLTNGAITSITVNTAGSGYGASTSVLSNAVDASNLTLNMPDEYLMGVLRWAAVFFLQGNEPENQRAMQSTWTNYLAWCKGLKSNGAGTMGKQAEYRRPRRGGITMVKHWTDTLYQGG